MLCLGYTNNATQRNATQRNATQRNATQRNATQRNATQRNATKSVRAFLIFVAFFLFLFPQFLFAQAPDISFKPPTVNTPNAAAISKFIDIPVSYHTGVPNISVPITTVTEGELSVGVSLNYNSSGIKTDEVSGSIGLGWALNAGGVISRAVVGAPDETGFYANGGNNGGYPNGLTDGSSCDNDPNCNYLIGDDCRNCQSLMEDIHYNRKDAEPDIFNFSFGGYSGKFVFGNDGILHMLQANDLVVDYSNWTNKQWIITDPKGIKYYFGNFFSRNAYETAYPDPGNFANNPTSTSWYLVRVESPDGRHWIDLDYAAESYTYSTPTGQTATPPVSTGIYSLSDPIMARNNVTGVRIKSIVSSSSQQSVLFNTDNSTTGIRIDLSGARGIKQIQVANGSFCKNFNLTQSYFVATASGTLGNFGASDNNRLRLDQVQEVSCDGTATIPPYIFSYNATALPPLSTLGKDVWGYYNGKDVNTGLLPASIPNVYSGNIALQITKNGDRTPDETKMKAGILEKITFPAGGRTELTYEAHRLTPTSTSIIGGLRIKFETTFNSDGTQAMKNEYVYNQGQSFGDSPDNGTNYFSQITRNVLNQSQVTGLAGANNTLPNAKTFSSSAFHGLQGYHIGYNSVSLKRLDGSTSTFNHIFTSYVSPQTFDYPYPPTIGVQDNVIMNHEEHKDALGNLVQSKDYIYQITPTGQTNAKRYYFVPWGTVSIYFLSRYALQYNRKTLTSTTEVMDGVTKTVTYGYNATFAHLNPTSITTNGSNGDQSQVVIKYPADIDASHPNFLNKVIFTSRNMTSIPLEVREYYKGNLVRGALEEYQTINDTINAAVGRYGVPVYVPYKFYRINCDNTTELRATITQIASDGKPNRVTKTGFNTTDYFYWDVFNRLFRQTTKANTQGDTLSKSYAYAGSSVLFTGNSSILAQAWDENGLTKKFYYDGLSRLYTIQDRMKPDGSDVQATTNYVYNYGTPYSYVGTTLSISDGNGNGFNSGGTFSTKQYMDGLGRPAEIVKEYYTAINNYHQKTYVTYDALGRQDKAYQPFESSALGIETPTSAVAYKQTVYENSPLSRPLKQYAEDGTFVQMIYGTNIAADAVNVFYTDVSGNVAVNGTYAVNTLMKTTAINENGKKTDIFKDILGRNILVRKYDGTTNADTYYIYDNNGDMIMVIPPAGISGTTPIANLNFIYQYDVKHRLISKKVPGAEKVLFYYDNRDLVTLTQDGNMRNPAYGGATNKFLATVYDDFGRVITTGWQYTTPPSSGDISPAVIAATDILTQNVYYPNSTWLKDNGAKVLAPSGVSPVRNMVWSYIERRQSLNYKGNPVWQGKQHLMSQTFENYGYGDVAIADGAINPNDNSGIDWSVSVYNGAQKPNYVSRVLTSHTSTQNVNTINYFHYDNGLRLDNINYSYNPAGNGSTTLKTLSNMVYNYKDQLVQKNIGKGDSYADNNNNYLQGIDYAYNIRGWLTNINTLNVYQSATQLLNPIPTNTMTGPKTTSGFLGATVLENVMATTGRDAMFASPIQGVLANRNTDLFSEEIRYGNPYSQTGAAGQFNGNISAAAWQVQGREIQAYAYKYDDLDRMIEGNYYDVHDPTTVPIWSGTSGFSNDFKYSEQLTYDQRGNIKTLLRNGLAYGSMTNTGQASGTFGPIDNLTYSYDPNNPNRITGITDATGSAAGFGFRNSNAYSYDDNGNLIRDDNKQITKIIYNYLNLPVEIQFWNGYAIIKFTYDAAGNKLMKSTFVNGVNTGNAGNPANRYYAGGVEYTGSTANGTGAVIDMIPNAEGFTRHETDGSYSDNFVFRDHLGNTRVVFSDKNNDGYININTELVQVNAYYPFGLNHGANSNGAGAPYKYQYNGKELNDDLGLNWNDYGARFYDPAIARWNSIDPLVEKFSNLSPYNYTLNNPIKYIDPDGMDGRVTYEKGEGTKAKPNVITIKANYYYNKNTLGKTVTNALNAAIAVYNKTQSETGSEKKGDFTIIKFELSAIGKESDEEAKDAALKDTFIGTESNETHQMGNFIGHTDKPDGDALAFDLNGHSIMIVDPMMAKGQSLGYDLQKALNSALLHEIGHNLGGEHGDVDPMGAHVTLTFRQENPNCLGEGCKTIPYTEQKSLSRKLAPTLIDRIDKPTVNADKSVGRRYLEHQKN